MSTILECKNLSKKYGRKQALDNITLSLESGRIIGLLGPNGSGKTTTISCLLALLRYDKGEIDIFGEKMTPDSYELKKNIGIVPQEIAVFDELTVRQNIDYFCGLYINDRKKRKKAEKMGCTFSCSSDVTDGLRQHRINGKQHIVRVGHFGSF